LPYSERPPGSILVYSEVELSIQNCERLAASPRLVLTYYKDGHCITYHSICSVMGNNNMLVLDKDFENIKQGK
jgi:hypothetical protein